MACYLFTIPFAFQTLDLLSESFDFLIPCEVHVIALSGACPDLVVRVVLSGTLSVEGREVLSGTYVCVFPHVSSGVSPA